MERTKFQIKRTKYPMKRELLIGYTFRYRKSEVVKLCKQMAKLYPYLDLKILPTTKLSKDVKNMPKEGYAIFKIIRENNLMSPERTKP